MEYSDMPGMFGWHVIAMIVLAILGTIGLAYLVLYFRGMVADDTGAILREGVLRRLRTAERTTFGPQRAVKDRTEPTEEDAYIVIPDIRGYTRFLQLSRFTLGHAQYVVSALLQSMLDAVPGHGLQVAKIEGDAILFFGLTKENGGHTITADALNDSITAILRAFYTRRAELVRDNACPCGACHHVEDLELKVIVHRGPILRYRLSGGEELSGVPVIAAHRLLKNSVDLDRYVLVTNAARKGFVLPPAETITRHVEQTDVGEITADVYGFQPDAVIRREAVPTYGGMAAKVADAALKMNENIRILRRGA